MAPKMLTPLAVKAAKPKRGADGQLVRNEIPDRGCTGLYLLVQPGGGKSWAVCTEIRFCNIGDEGR
jgi:hypothetical protein